MFFSELSMLLNNSIFFVLHIINFNYFPKPLSKEEENKCLKLIKKGDKKAKNKLIEHNLRLVSHITKKYHNSKIEVDDLISIGTIGLIKAINTYNTDKGIKLSSYASRCIENEILMYFRNIKKTSLDISINEPIDTDKNGNVITLIDTIHTSDPSLEEIESKININKLNKNLPKFLSEREQKIISLRYGLSNNKPLPQREVAKLLGISRSYVSRIEKRAINNLKKLFK